MTLLILWLLATLLVGTCICLLARWQGPAVIIGAYAASLCAAIVVAGKLGSVPGFPALALSASIFVYSITFLFTDVLSEVYGKTVARKAILVGACVYPILFISAQFAIEWKPHPFWAENQAAFSSTMGTTLRVLAASLCAFVVSQLHDVWAFHFWKEKTSGRHLWLRNTLSTATSQAIDTVVFYVIAFYGVFPVWKLILLTYSVKLIIAIVDTPFVYFIAGFLRNVKSSLAESSQE